MSYKIVGDSCTELPMDLKRDEHFCRVPLTLQIGEESFIDDETFSQKIFLQRMKESSECARSACPSPDAFIQAFEGADEIFVITLSSKLSGSYNSAELARAIYLENHPNKKIEVIPGNGDLDISPVSDYIDIEKPKDEKEKKEIVIPKEKK